jgi:methylthioribulose-1-phosphate dehydratase
MSQEEQKDNNDHLVKSEDPEHPANLIPELCRKFYNWGWVTGTGGGVSAPVASQTHPSLLANTPG